MTQKIEQIGIYGFTGRGSAGKDTQGALLKEQLENSTLISTGDIVRGANDPNSPYYAKYHDILALHQAKSERGGLVPDDVMVGIVEQEIAEARAKGITNFIFTGFPRTIGQELEMEKMVARLQEQGAEVNYKNICLLVPEQVSRNRAEWRRELAVLTDTPVRRDDQPEVVERRLQEYRESTMPMQEMLAKKKELIVIDGNGTIEQVRTKMLEALDIVPSETLVRRAEVGAFTEEASSGGGAVKLVLEIEKRKALFGMVQDIALPTMRKQDREEIINRLKGLYEGSKNNISLLAIRMAIRIDELITFFENPANRPVTGFDSGIHGQTIKPKYLKELVEQQGRIDKKWGDEQKIEDYVSSKAFSWLTEIYLTEKTW
ncbi:MAG: nucleoside monophosphate kinase [Candidatus Shapirobacteria bacterium]|jgi:adenylate kinase